MTEEEMKRGKNTLQLFKRYKVSFNRYGHKDMEIVDEKRLRAFLTHMTNGRGKEQKIDDIIRQVDEGEVVYNTNGNVALENIKEKKQNERRSKKID